MKRIELELEVAQMIRIHSKKIGACRLAEMIVDKSEEAHRAVIREITTGIDNILSDAIRESEKPNGRELQYFFVDRLITLKQEYGGIE